MSEAEADAYADELEGDWRVYEMEVRESAPNKASSGRLPQPIELREDDDSCQCLMCGDVHRRH